MKIKCADIIADPADNTSRDELNRMNPQDCVGLAKTIDQQGQIQPVVVIQEGDKYRLAAGFRRFTAISIVLGWEEIDAKVFPAGTDTQLINALENFQRNNPSFWEQCCALRAIYPDDIEMKQIERDMGMSKQWVNVRWKAWRLPEEVKGQIAAGLLGFTDVQMLVQDGVDSERAAQKLIDGKAAGKTTHQMRKNILEHRRNIRGKKAIQQTMTKCLAIGNMTVVQALRYAIGEIEEKSLLNWLKKHQSDTNIE